MATRYTSSGYSTPSGISSRDDVRAIQQQLGVKADGIWGPQTQAAYDNQQRQNQISELQSMIRGMGGGVSVPSVNMAALRADYEAALRPAYEGYMDSRRRQTQINRAEIDADAASRGMTGSTWTTDAKSRQVDAEASDIAGYEAQYAGALANAVNSAAAQQQALGLQAAQMGMAARQQQVEALMQLMQMQNSMTLQPVYRSSGSPKLPPYESAVAKALNNKAVADNYRSGVRNTYVLDKNGKKVATVSNRR